MFEGRWGPWWRWLPWWGKAIGPLLLAAVVSVPVVASDSHTAPHVAVAPTTTQPPPTSQQTTTTNAATSTTSAPTTSSTAQPTTSTTGFDFLTEDEFPVIPANPLPPPEPTVHSDQPPTERTGSGRVDLSWPTGTRGVIRLTHTGADRFRAWAVDATGGERRLLADTTGDYTGSRLINVDHAANHVDVETEGTWSVTVSDPEDAPRFAAAKSGNQSQVLVYDGPTGPATVSHVGAGPFELWHHTETTSILIIDSTDDAQTHAIELPAGPALLEVIAPGGWSITPDGN